LEGVDGAMGYAPAPAPPADEREAEAGRWILGGCTALAMGVAFIGA
jgi:hypothetical protein